MKKLSIILFTVLALVACKSSAQRDLERTVKDMNAYCPMAITDFVQLESFAVEPDLTLRINYTALTDYFDADYVKTEANKRQVAMGLLLVIENNPKLAKLRFHAVYSDTEGDMLGEMVITPEDIVRYQSGQGSAYEEFIAQLKQDTEEANLPQNVGENLIWTKCDIDETSHQVSYEYEASGDRASELRTTTSRDIKARTVDMIRQDPSMFASMMEMLTYVEVLYNYVDERGKQLVGFSLTWEDLKPKV